MRALVAPLLLVGTVVLSFAAALGVSSLVFDHIFHFAGSSSVPAAATGGVITSAGLVLAGALSSRTTRRRRSSPDAMAADPATERGDWTDAGREPERAGP